MIPFKINLGALAFNPSIDNLEGIYTIQYQAKIALLNDETMSCYFRKIDLKLLRRP